jgi:hypothetical protein
MKFSKKMLLYFPYGSQAEAFMDACSATFPRQGCAAGHLTRLLREMLDEFNNVPTQAH